MRTFSSISRRTSLQERLALTAKAVAVDDLNLVIDASESIAPYQFEESVELTKKLRSASGVRVFVSVTDDGTELNSCEYILNGKPHRCRVFGLGKGVQVVPREFSKEEIEKAVWGFCTSSGERVAYTTLYKGEPKTVPYIYLYTER